MRGKCPALEHISIRGKKCHKEIDRGVEGWGGGELAATSDLAAFLFSMIAPVKISVNHLRTVVSMHAINSMAPVPH